MFLAAERNVANHHRRSWRGNFVDRSFGRFVCSGFIATSLFATILVWVDSVFRRFRYNVATLLTTVLNDRAAIVNDRALVLDNRTAIVDDRAAIVDHFAAAATRRSATTGIDDLTAARLSSVTASTATVMLNGLMATAATMVLNRLVATATTVVLNYRLMTAVVLLMTTVRPTMVGAAMPATGAGDLNAQHADDGNTHCDDKNFHTTHCFFLQMCFCT